MELRQIAATLWKWAWLIVLATVVAAASSWWVVRGQPPIYQTSSTLMIGTTIEQVSPDYSEFYTAQQLAQTYSELIRREPVLKGTAAALGFEEQWRSLQGQVSAALVAGTQLMEIRVVDTDPVRAKRIADEITRQLMATVAQARPQGSSRKFIEEQVAALPPKIEAAQKEIGALQEQLGQTSSAREIQDLQSQVNTLENQVNGWRATFAQYQLLLGDTGVNVLTVVEEAQLPTHPIGSRRLMQVALAAAVGLMLAVGAAFLIEYLDDTVKSPQDVERTTKLSTFGVIIRFPRSDEGGLLAALQPKSAIAEGYRVLRTNLQFAVMGLDKPRQSGHSAENAERSPANNAGCGSDSGERGTEYRSGAALLVTSAQPTEGKTTSLANLGVSLAQAGRRVLLVDTDLRRPSLHKLFNLSKEAGLMSLLLDREADVQHVIRETGVEGLRVLPSGPVPANPAEVLGFSEMGALLERLRTMADYVLLDSPPVLNVADASVLAQKVDGVLMVVEAGRTRTEMFERAVTVLQGVKARVLGTILTKVGVRRGAYAYDYYYYYSSYYTDEEGGVRNRRRRHRPGLIGRLERTIARLFGRRAEAHVPDAAVRDASVELGTPSSFRPTAAACRGGTARVSATAPRGVGGVGGAGALALEVEEPPPVEVVLAEVPAGAPALEVEGPAAEDVVAEVPTAAPALEVEGPPPVEEAVTAVPVGAHAVEVERLPSAEEMVAKVPVGTPPRVPAAAPRGVGGAGASALRIEGLPAEELVTEVTAGAPALGVERTPPVEEVDTEVPVGAPALKAEGPPAEEVVTEVTAGVPALTAEAPPPAEEVVAEVAAGASALKAEGPPVEEAVTEVTADANAIYAEAMEHYRNGEWRQAHDALFRLKAIDPARPGLDALLNDVERMMQHDRSRQLAPAQTPKAALGTPSSVLHPASSAGRVSATAPRALGGVGGGRRPRVRVGQVLAVILLLLGATAAALMYAGVLPVPRLPALFFGNQVQTYINRGYDFFIVDNYEEAIQSFNKALELDPDNAEAKLGLQHATQYLELRDLYGQARALMAQNSFDAAIVKLQTIIKTDPWYEDADTLLSQCQRSQELEGLYEQAMGYYNAGDWAKAASAFEALQGKGAAAGEMEISSKLFDCYLNAGRQQIAAADSRSAIIRATLSFNSALALSPNDLATQEERQLASLYLDGYTAYERADWRQVIANLSRIHAMRPDYAQGQAARLLCASYTKLGDSYQANGQLQLALDQYRLVQTYAQCDQTEVSGKIQQVLALLGPVTPSPTATP